MQHNDTQLNNVLNNWQILPVSEKPLLVKTFTTGLNHKTYLIHAGVKPFVLKLFQQPNHSAINTQRWATKHKLAPNVFYSNDDGTVLLMAYLDSDTLSKSAIDTQTINRLGKTLRSLHSQPCADIENNISRFDYLAYCKDYLNKLGTNDKRPRELHDKLLPTLNLFLNDATPWCLCHNDLVAENIFANNDDAQFIDWEFTQINNPWFDLASLIYYMGLNNNQIQQLIMAYQPTWQDKRSAPIINASLCAVIWVDMLWRLTKTNEPWSMLDKQRDNLISLL